MAIKMDDLVALTQGNLGQGSQASGQFLNLLLSQYPQLAQQLGELQAGMPNLQGQMNAPLPNTWQSQDLALPEFTSQGFTPEAMAALMGQNIDRASQAFDTEGSALKASLARRGIMGAGDQPGSGIGVPLLAQLAASKAMAGPNAIRDAILENQKQIYLNRRDLSVPTRALAAEFANQRNRNNLTYALGSNENELARRRLALDALAKGYQGIDTGNELLRSLQAGYGTASGQQVNSLGQLTAQKRAALENDRSGIANAFMGGLGQGLGGGVGSLIGGIKIP